MRFQPGRGLTVREWAYVEQAGLQYRKILFIQQDFAGLRRAKLGGRKTQSIAPRNPEGIPHAASLTLVAALPRCAGLFLT